MASLIGKVTTILIKKLYRPLLKRVNFDILKYRKFFFRLGSVVGHKPKKVKIISAKYYGLNTQIITPIKIHKKNDLQRHVLMIHGGGFLLPTQPGHIEFAADLAKRLQAQVHLPDYRLAPESSFPAAFDDCLQYYLGLNSTLDSMQDLILVGDSAGGNLALALTRKLIDIQCRLPKVLVLISPLTGHCFQTEFSQTHLPEDAMFDQTTLEFFMKQYLKDFDVMDDIRLAPIVVGFKGFPPMIFTASQKEALFRDTMEAYKQAVRDDVKVEIVTEPELFHVYPLVNFIPEAQKARAQIVEFILKHLKSENVFPTEAKFNTSSIATESNANL